MFIFNYTKQLNKPTMNKFNKTIGKYFIKLQGTMITILYDGQMVKAFDTNPLYSVDKLNETIKKLERIA
jgi:hypothetical protein